MKDDHTVDHSIDIHITSILSMIAQSAALLEQKIWFPRLCDLRGYQPGYTQISTKLYADTVSTGENTDTDQDPVK